FVQDNSSEWLTADGWRLFDAAVDYAQQSSVSVDQEIAAQPVIFDLKQNFPNPFNPSTNIEFQSALDTSVKIEIYNVYGQLVNTLLDGEKKTGVHSVTWRGVDQNGESLASGIYYYRMTAQNGDEMFTMTRKMMLLR
ncbi:T9SS type A sorting domain-containing protein, partial [candidate division KSB1 bacterium]